MIYLYELYTFYPSVTEACKPYLIRHISLLKNFVIFTHECPVLEEKAFFPIKKHFDKRW